VNVDSTGIARPRIGAANLLRRLGKSGSMLAPRFLDDFELKNCLEGLRTFVLGDSEIAIQRIQQALIDLQFLLPGFDTGTFDLPTEAAIFVFQGANGLSANGTVDAETMTVLNDGVMDKPPEPFTDREEWLTWQQRSSFPEIDPVNFTRLDLFQRLASFQTLTLHENSAWFPPLMASKLIEGILALLDPVGSPDGVGTAPGSWGTFPIFDFNHCHIGFGEPAPPGVEIGTEVTNKSKAIRRLADEQSGGAERGSAEWTQVHQALLQPTDPNGGELMFIANEFLNGVLSKASDDHPLLMIFHTFEVRFRPADMQAEDPKRHWHIQIDPPGPGVERNPWVTSQLMKDNFFHAIQINFLVNKSGQVIVMPDMVEVASVAGIPYQAVADATGASIPVDLDL